MIPRRAVITGLGVVAPGGVGVKAFWELLSSGRTATRTISLFDATGFRSQVAAEVDFDPLLEGLTDRQAGELDRVAQFALCASAQAIADAKLPVGAAPHRTAVSVGSAVGCTMVLEQEYVRLSEHGTNWLVDHSRAAPHLFQALMPSTVAAEVAWLAQAEGPCAVVSTGCTSGLDAVAHAAALIAESSADVVLAGASDAPISPISAACFDAIKATTPRNDDPAHASRPFDRTRNGFVLGEGAAMFVVEEISAARRRGASIYCEIAGYGQRANAYHMTGLRPDGVEMAEAIRIALRRAALAPDRIDYINAHGSGTRQNDIHETAAFKRSLGAHAYATPISSIKSMVGHSLGAIGSIELAACALAMQHSLVPPTANLDEPDPDCDLDYVPHVARERSLRAVLNVGSGFGGFQTAIVLTDTGLRDAE